MSVDTMLKSVGIAVIIFVVAAYLPGSFLDFLNTESVGNEYIVLLKLALTIIAVGFLAKPLVGEV